jgi:hypothetical protein
MVNMVHLLLVLEESGSTYMMMLVNTWDTIMMLPAHHPTQSPAAPPGATISSS